MDSRNLLRNVGKVQVLLDTNSFDLLIAQRNRVALAILGHNNSELLEFVRTPLITISEELQKIPEYGFELDADAWIKGISILRANCARRVHFGYSKESILSIAKVIFGKAEVTDQEFERVLLIFVQATLIDLNRHETHIFITNDPVLLKKRIWFESHFPGGQLNVMSSEEASVFFDIYFKKKEKYLISADFSLNKGYWYLLSMRLKLSHYNVGDSMIDALSQRFEYSLMALDEIGIQFWSGTNNDTMDNTLYHFNYLVSLMTGIFDNLALKTNTQLGIAFDDLRKVCINNHGGREFLREIRGKNQALRDHISNYMSFINLIYEFRELVIHREGLANTAFENRGENWKANFIRVNIEVRERLRTCGDVPSEFDPLYNVGFLWVA
ncbi:MAG: hypothetical protein ABSF44_10175 [Candidatus Bathyarchaeia archaeon]|jgi:hypothetical protein